MGIEIRSCASVEEVRQAITPIGYYFGRSAPAENQAERLIRTLPAERVYAAWEGDRAVGGLGANAGPLENQAPIGLYDRLRCQAFLCNSCVIRHRQAENSSADFGSGRYRIRLKKLTELLFETLREGGRRRLQILVQRFDSASGLQGSRACGSRRSDPR
jgi:hypothetical protein